MDANGIKINPELNIDSKKIKKTNNVKNGDLHDDSINQSADVINNIQNKVVLSPDLIKLLGTTQDGINNKIKMDLMTKRLDILEKSFQEVSPLFIAANGSSINHKEQIDMLVSESTSEAYKRQSIQALSVLSKKDLSLLEIVRDTYGIASFLGRLLSYNMAKDATENTKENVERLISKAELAISNHKQEYGYITYGSFENLKNNNIVLKEENSYFPILELLFKAFLHSALDKSQNEEYLAEPIKTRTQERRSNWTGWYRSSQFKGTFVEGFETRILALLKNFPAHSYWTNENQSKGYLYCSITQVGTEILKVI